MKKNLKKVSIEPSNFTVNEFGLNIKGIPLTKVVEFKYEGKENTPKILAFGHE